MSSGGSLLSSLPRNSLGRFPVSKTNIVKARSDGPIEVPPMFMSMMDLREFCILIGLEFQHTSSSDPLLPNIPSSLGFQVPVSSRSHFPHCGD